MRRAARKPGGTTHALWECLCDCGTQKVIGSNALRTGYTQSCGCLKREATAARNTTHGLSNTPTYQSWCNMVRRCTHVNDPRYPDWGGRADMGEKPPGLTLDRLDNDGSYEPGNCRWATRKQQQANRRNSRTT
jgi:hypothetical protein